MIPKIICFIFGHTRKRFIKEYIKYQDVWETIWYGYWLFWDNCPRCGKNLRV